MKLVSFLKHIIILFVTYDAIFTLFSTCQLSVFFVFFEYA